MLKIGKMLSVTGWSHKLWVIYPWPIFEMHVMCLESLYNPYNAKVM